MKEDLNLNENLNEFLKEWEYHTTVLSSNDIIYFYGFTEDPKTSKYMVVMDYANKACYISRLLDFTGKKLNEVLDSEYSQAYDCAIRDSRPLDENTSKKMNQILESEGSQASSLDEN
ncbi:kinase-like domain-containing protein [Rhizophagus irregularis DAOM 181602=DAOM 197198]|nr:kinase-like domain-containing protein [Rhizophagus irregularis DAOM 181602=DAOM 197198]